MPLIQKLQDDAKTALRGGDIFSLGVLRMLLSAIHNKEIEKRGNGLSEELTDDEARAVLAKEMKKRQDAIALYEQGGRADLAEQEKKEAAFIQRYLPAPLSRAEAEKAIAQILSKSDFSNFGAAMKAVMAELKGIADAQVVSEIIHEIIKK